MLRAGEEATAVPSSEHHHSPEWCAWLVEHDQFRFVGDAGHFSARREGRKACGDYWYAYRRRDGILHKAYLGKASDLTGMAIFLASAEADYIVAQTYNVDGGNWMS